MLLKKNILTGVVELGKLNVMSSSFEEKFLREEKQQLCTYMEARNG